MLDSDVAELYGVQTKEINQKEKKQGTPFELPCFFSFNY